ncbi:unnamed protein product [Sympodiomycopsis kandeliae]
MSAPFDDPLSALAGADATANALTWSHSSPIVNPVANRGSTSSEQSYAGTISGRKVSAIESRPGQHYFDLKALQAQLAEAGDAAPSAQQSLHSNHDQDKFNGTLARNGGGSRRSDSPTQTLQHRSQSRIGQRLAADHQTGKGNLIGAETDGAHSNDAGLDAEVRSSASSSGRGPSHRRGSSARPRDRRSLAGSRAGSVYAQDSEGEEGASEQDNSPKSSTPKSIRAPSSRLAQTRLSAPNATATSPRHSPVDFRFSVPSQRHPVTPGSTSRPSSRAAHLSGHKSRHHTSLASLWLEQQDKEAQQRHASAGPDDLTISPEDQDAEDEYLARLHLMSDEELQAFLSATIRVKRPFLSATSRPLLAALQPTDPVGRRSDQHTLSSPELPSQARLSPGPQDIFTPAETDDTSLEVCRKLSRALAKSKESYVALAARMQEQAIESHRMIEAQTRANQVREEAMRTVCSSHGISAGTIDRAVARAVAEMPQVSIDVQQQARARQTLSPTPDVNETSLHSRSASVGQNRRQSTRQTEQDRHSKFIQAFPEAQHSLGFSLQEAMLEDLEGEFGHPAGRARNVDTPDSAATTKDVLDRRESSTDSMDATPRSKRRSASSRHSRRVSGASVATSIDMRTPTKSSSNTADGLMPWSAKKSDRKASATTKTTSSAAVEADGYLSDGRSVSGATSGAESPLGTKAREDLDEIPDLPISRTTSSNRRPSNASTYNSATLKAPPSSSSSSTNSAFGFFSSLAWRRKKAPSASTLAVPQQHQQSTAGRTSSMPVTSPSSSAFSSTLPPQTPEASSVRGADSPSQSVFGCPSSPGIADEIAKTRAAVNQVERTVSGRDVISALHEAIGSAPVSPSEKPAHAIDVKALPKPSHLKAIFLATRILGPDASSVLINKGRNASNLVSGLAFALVSAARAEGLTVNDRPTETIGSGRSRRSTLSDHRRARQAALDATTPGQRKARGSGHKERPQSVAVQAASAVVQAAAAAAAASSNATMGRKNQAKPADKKKSMVEPNVTRLPLYLGLSQGYSGAGAVPQSAPPTSGVTRQTTETAGSDTARPAPPVELESIVPLDGKPPSLAIFSRNRFRHLQGAGANHSSSRRGKREPRRMRSIIDKQQGSGERSDQSEESESSGDEFEVYGGKGNIVLPTPIHSASHASATSMSMYSTSSQNADSNGVSASGYDDRAVDVFGFVYDATPADVRLLRQARLASTPAPACLTGIRVGVAARGAGSDSDSEAAEQSETERDDDRNAETDGGLAGASKKSDSDVESVEVTSQSDMDIDSTRSKKQAHPIGLLGIEKARPSTEATQLSASCLVGLDSEGPTSPTQELDFKFGAFGPDVKKGPVKNVGAKTTSETIVSLLDQLKVMHSNHQAEQMAKWDIFIKHRRKVLSEALTVGSDAMHDRKKALSGNAQSAMAGLSSVSMGEVYHYGLIGLQQMGEDKTSKDDFQHFLKLCQEGIPLAHRPKVWAECSAANEVAEPGKYQDLLDEHAGETNQALSQIDLDVHRTMPTNIYFGGDGPGVPKLRRVLAAYSWYSPEIGYCQGMNNLAATLLLTHATEEEAFWVLVCIIEKILPPEYFTSHLLTSQADQRVLIELVSELLPRLAEHLDDLGVDLPAVTFAWFLSLYTDCLPVETLFRVWDVFFAEGAIVLFRIAIGILTMNEDALLATTSPAAFYGHVHSMTSRLFSVDRLMQIACRDLRTVITVDKVESKRKRHVADLKTELALD